VKVASTLPSAFAAPSRPSVLQEQVAGATASPSSSSFRPFRCAFLRSLLLLALRDGAAIGAAS